MSRWTVDDLPELTSRTFVVTGANSGIGYEAALVLARKGARVILACRSAERAKGALANVLATRPDARAEVMPLDLASLASVRAFAAALADRLPDGFDALVNNAGVMALPRATTADGFEMQLGTNHLGHFALTGLVLPLLARRPEARVVNVSSGFHWLGRMRFDDLMGERSYGPWSAYAQSKLANLLFTNELKRRLADKHPNVLSVAAHPGYANTNLQFTTAAASGGGFRTSIAGAFNGALAQSAASGALPTLRAAAGDGVKSGDFYGARVLMAWGAPARAMESPAARDAAAARTLWDASVKLTGVDYAGL